MPVFNPIYYLLDHRFKTPDVSVAIQSWLLFKSSRLPFFVCVVLLKPYYVNPCNEQIERLFILCFDYVSRKVLWENTKRIIS